MEPEIKTNENAAPAGNNNGNAPTVTTENDTAAAPISEPAPVGGSTVSLPANDDVKEVQSAAGFPLKQYIIAAILVLIIGGLLWVGLERQGRVDTKLFDQLTGLMGQSQSAAIVNGKKISMADYEKNRQQIIVSAQQQGLDINEPSIQNEINSQAIQVLVNTELLKQSASAAGIVITDQQVDDRYQEVVASVGGTEILETRMAELGLNEASLRKDIEGELLIQTFLSSSVDTSSIALVDDEIEAVYEQAGGAEAGLPPLEDVRAEIEAQLRFAKEQELVNNFIQSLREAANIEVLI